ncbi:MAG: discoidin domain-containing protein [Thermoanaerobaculia bacterium]
MKRLLAVVAGAFLLAASPRAKEPVLLDPFDDPSGWTAAPSDGVKLSVTGAEGLEGRALRLDFDFQGHGGYAVVRKAFAVDLPGNYEFRFRVRGDAPANNLEFKLVDPSGDNVWWVNRRGFEVPGEWQEVRIKKRHVSFAWGPAGGGEIRRVAAVELAITAGEGGTGWIAFDELTLRELPPAAPYRRVPSVTASSSAPGSAPARILDGDGATAWETPETSAWVALDFLENREYGGLTIRWDETDYPRRFTVEVSEDGKRWTTVRTVAAGASPGASRSDSTSRGPSQREESPRGEEPRAAGAGASEGPGERSSPRPGEPRAGAMAGPERARATSHLMLPEAESRHLRLKLSESSRGRGFGIRELTVRPPEFGASPNDFFLAIAREAPRGSFPRSFSGEQVYWTLVGTDGDPEEALLSEDGALEIRKGGPSVEPFLFEDGALATWASVTSTQSLSGGYLPIPSVAWKRKGISLEVTAFAEPGPGDASTLYARYRAQNGAGGRQRAKLVLALRPFQVNPPSQFLNTPGGVARVETMSWNGRWVTVNGKEIIDPIDGNPAFGAIAFDEGDLVDLLRRGEAPERAEVADPTGFASAVLAYDLDLAAGETKTVSLRIPFRPAALFPATLAQRMAATEKDWTAKLGTVGFRLPAAAAPLVATLRSNLAYVLINRDGPAIQPGSRAYERSWIRDGALTSAALLRLGHERPVREFIVWYAPKQFENGKVPCCVDARGADPVPENDSHGELIYLIAEHHRFTGDRAFLSELWPRVEKAAEYIELLRQQRRTEEYRRPEKAHFFGLLPESISHEGYSAKPMHSYWDDFWALRGLEDAAELAVALGKQDLAKRYAAIRDEFRRELFASLAAAMKLHRIDYLPGAAELGDFDATSTTIAISPGGELSRLPRAAVTRTFEKYFDEFRKRRDGQLAWEGYTPYELRNVGVFVRLGWKERAHELLDFFMKDRRPESWNQWPEAVARLMREPRFLGDLPHTWVGSDFIRSFLDFFAYLRAEDGALILAAGIPESWVRGEGGVGIDGLRTEYGPLAYTLSAEGPAVRLRIPGTGLRMPPGGLVVQWRGRETRIRELPADVRLP